jgi:hypothetical protein
MSSAIRIHLFSLPDSAFPFFRFPFFARHRWHAIWILGSNPLSPTNQNRALVPEICGRI